MRVRQCTLLTASLLLSAFQLNAQTEDAEIASNPGIRSTLPAVIAYPSAIVCTWREEHDTARYLCGSWDIEANSMGPSFRYSIPERVDAGTSRWPSRVTEATTHSSVDTNRSHIFAGDFTLACIWAARSNVTVSSATFPPTSSSARIASSRTAFARPVPQGWETIELTRNQNTWDYPPFNQLTTEGWILGSDPGSGDILGFMQTTEFGNPKGSMLRCYHRNGTSWSIDYPVAITSSSTALPLGESRYMAISDNNITLVEGKTRGSSFQFPNVGTPPRYAKLQGPYIVRTWWDKEDTLRLQAEIYDLQGNRRNAVEIARPEHSDYMLIQSPADSSIVILFGGSRGLRAAILTPALHPIATDTLLSRATGAIRHPAGAFRNDTLFAVWEDNGSAPSRIMGTYQRIRTTSTLSAEESGATSVAMAAASLYPNPATERITVRAELPNRDGITLEVASALGEEVLRRKMFQGEDGVREESVDIGGLPRGIYLARIHVAGRVIMKSFVKH